MALVSAPVTLDSLPAADQKAVRRKPSRTRQELRAVADELCRNRL
jgi:hypothetical protein